MPEQSPSGDGSELSFRQAVLQRRWRVSASSRTWGVAADRTRLGLFDAFPQAQARERTTARAGILGNRVMLKRVYRPADNNRLMLLHRGGTIKAPGDFLTRLNEVFESEPALTLSRVAMRLEVSNEYLRRVAPDVAARIVQRGREARHVRKSEREEARFDEYYKSFLSLCIENVYPAKDKVVKRVRRHNGTTLSFDEARRFHQRACHLAEPRLDKLMKI